MRITCKNLVDAFISHVLERQSYADYEAKFPELFDHYYEYWAERSVTSDYPDAGALRESALRIQSSIPILESLIEKTVPFPLNEIDIVLFVGLNCTNGHAFSNGGRIIVWLPVEAYPSLPSVMVFVTHELVHALHYQQSPKFMFTNHSSKNHIGRQLATEGLATLLTTEILQIDDLTALWGDYMPNEWRQSWLATRALHVHSIAEHALSNFDNADAANHLFTFAGAAYEDPLCNRTGYWLGLEVLRKIKNDDKLNNATMLSLDRSHLEHRIKCALGSLI